MSKTKPVYRFKEGKALELLGNSLCKLPNFSTVENNAAGFSIRRRDGNLEYYYRGGGGASSFLGGCCSQGLDKRKKNAMPILQNT